MAFSIDSEVLTERDYNKMVLALEMGGVVSLLAPLHTRDEIYQISDVRLDPHPPANRLYELDCQVILGEEVNPRAVWDSCSEMILELGYSITGKDDNYKLSMQDLAHLYIVTLDGQAINLSSTDVLVMDELKLNVPVFLKLLESMVNRIYSFLEAEQDLSLIPAPIREPTYKPRYVTEMGEGGESEGMDAFEVIPRKFLDVTFDDVGGCREAKEKLMLIDLGIRFPRIYDIYKADLPRGVLFYGPPGTGKTLLAKAAARELDADFYSINGSDILSKWYGESEKNLKELFDRAKLNTPAVIFIDEIDSLMPSRDYSHEVTVRVISLLLQEMDGIKSSPGLIIMGASNRPKHIDPAFLRPGRFDLKLEVSLPDETSLEQIFRIHLSGRNLDDNIDYKKLAKSSIGLSGADVKGVVNSCVFNKIVNIRSKMPDVITRDVVDGVDTEPISNQELLRSIVEYKKELAELATPLDVADMYV